MTKPNKDASFKDFLLDALAGVPGLRARAMFGGYGVYSGETFFALISDGTAYLRVDDATRERFVQRGCRPFVYSRDGKEMSMSYYEIPDDLLEEHEMLRVWADDAIVAARRAKAASKKRA